MRTCPQDHLSGREAVIAVMVCNGADHREIASYLALPLRTVPGHVNHVLQTLHLSRAEDLTHELLAAHFVGREVKITPPSEQITALMVQVATARLNLERERETVRQLHEAVASRDIIGQAKGILMERHRISDIAAFALLRDGSSRSNRKLVDVARSLIHSGEESAEHISTPTGC